MMARLLLILIPFFLFACAGAKDESEARKRPGKRVYKPLTEEESRKLITPTVYYIPEYDQTDLRCEQTRALRDSKGQTLVTVCKNVFDDCLMQGTCKINVGSENLLLNVGSVVQGERRFTVIKDSPCLYGKGATKGAKRKYKFMCLDPYYSIAADLSIYSVGDVIHIPVAVGMRMPDGSIHDGYFVVRDTGGAIKGHGRFDFFIGFSHPRDESNPLVQMGFGDKETNVPYIKIDGDEAQAILKKRSFPILSVSK